MKHTAWLWYGSQIVASTMVETGATEQQIKEQAVREFDRCLIVEQFETPDERRRKIWAARIKFYNTESTRVSA